MRTPGRFHLHRQTGRKSIRFRRGYRMVPNQSDARRTRSGSQGRVRPENEVRHVHRPEHRRNRRRSQRIVESHVLRGNPQVNAPKNARRPRRRNNQSASVNARGISLGTETWRVRPHREEKGENPKPFKIKVLPRPRAPAYRARNRNDSRMTPSGRNRESQGCPKRSPENQVPPILPYHLV